MVLSQRQSRPQALLPQLDIARILGMAGAIAINATALMLLMVPIAAPPLPVEVEEPTVQPIFVAPEPIVIPQPPPPIPVQQPVRSERRQDTTPVPLPQVADPPVLVEDGELPPPQVTETVIDPPPMSNPLPNARLQYASAPAPAYPRDAMSKGLEGTVVLKVLVDVDGTPISVEIERSSGHFKLDDAAKRQVLRKWKFKPAIVDGRATQVYGIIPVSFSLTRE